VAHIRTKPGSKRIKIGVTSRGRAVDVCTVPGTTKN